MAETIQAETIQDRIKRDMKKLNAEEFEVYFKEQQKAFPDLRKDTEFLTYIDENKDKLLQGYNMNKDVAEWKESQKKAISEDLKAMISNMKLNAERAADRVEQPKVNSSGGKKSKKRKSKKSRKKSRKSHKKRFPHKKSRNKRR